MSWNPAASVPCGFTPVGLPVGMQMSANVRGFGRVVGLGGVRIDAVLEAQACAALNLTSVICRLSSSFARRVARYADE
nr:hypothetical protein [Mesorhizobium sp.]